MPARERTSAAASPPEDSTYVWMREVTSNMEHLTGRVSLVEKSVDNMSMEVRQATDVAKTAALALDRIAKADEDRLKDERARNKILAENDRDRLRLREKWLDRIWSSPAAQVFVGAITAAILNIFGLSYVGGELLSELVAKAQRDEIRGEQNGEP